MDNYFRYFAAKSNHPCKDDILADENRLVFNQFNENIVDKLIENALEIARENYNRPVGIRITHKEKLYKQLLMDGVSEIWLLRKEKVCLETGHSSYYIFLDNIDTHQYDYMIDDETYGICGGSFPLIVQDEVVGSITCTGLRPQEDHQVIVDSIQKVLCI